MSEDFINISRSLDTLTLAQVAEKINVKDIETAKKWLQEKRIKIHRFQFISIRNKMKLSFRAF